MTQNVHNVTAQNAVTQETSKEGVAFSKVIKARYRNKLRKIIVEVWNGDKWIYVKTLSNPLIEFGTECLAKVSSNVPQKAQNNGEKFGQYLLNEHHNIDTKSINELINEVIPPKKEDLPDD